jgi:hypothetical protein
MTFLAFPYNVSKEIASANFGRIKSKTLLGEGMAMSVCYVSRPRLHRFSYRSLSDAKLRKVYRELTVMVKQQRDLFVEISPAYGNYAVQSDFARCLAAAKRELLNRGYTIIEKRGRKVKYA